MQPYEVFRGWNWGGGALRNSCRAAPGCFSGAPWRLQSLALLLPAAPRAWKAALFPPCSSSSPEQHSATTNNFQEQFTNGGETKIKKSESCLWSNFVRFAPRVEHGVTIQRQMTLKTAEIRLSQCTSNIIWWCTHTAPRPLRRAFYTLTTHIPGTSNRTHSSSFQRVWKSPPSPHTWKNSENTIWLNLDWF